MAEREGIPEEHRERLQRAQKKALVQAFNTARLEAQEMCRDQFILEETEGNLTQAIFSTKAGAQAQERKCANTNPKDNPNKDPGTKELTSKKQESREP